MRSTTLLRAALLPALACAVLRAESARDTLKIPPGPASATPTTAAESRRVSKGILPDPALLDGSAHDADKKNEYGMLGEFEMPGDENVRNGKVGPQAKTSPPPQPQVVIPIKTKTPLPIGLPGGPGGVPGGTGMGIGVGMPNPAAPAAGGFGMGLPDPTAQSGAAGADAGAPAAADGGAMAATDSSPPGASPAGQGSRGGGAMDPNAKNAKPGAVMIGDPSLRLPNSPAAPEVVGRVNAGGAQQAMEKPVGQAAKSTTGDNSNRGAERGRPMPTGL